VNGPVPAALEVGVAVGVPEPGAILGKADEVAAHRPDRQPGLDLEKGLQREQPAWCAVISSVGFYVRVLQGIDVDAPGGGVQVIGNVLDVDEEAVERRRHRGDHVADVSSVRQGSAVQGHIVCRDHGDARQESPVELLDSPDRRVLDSGSSQLAFLSWSFDELALDEGRSGADQGDEVGSVHQAPAGLG
jgi:hypothetical protein